MEYLGVRNKTNTQSKSCKTADAVVGPWVFQLQTRPKRLGFGV